MLKIFTAFMVFALAALFVIMKGGDKVDMQGESSTHVEASALAASETANASAATPAASK
jgi:hypothetical protein